MAAPKRAALYLGPDRAPEPLLRALGVGRSPAKPAPRQVHGGTGQRIPYTHASPHQLTKEQEEDQLTRTRKILEGFGSEVTGYRSPSWDLSENTLPLLQKHGFRYSSNLMDDIRPYRHPDTDMIELPIQWILDDWVHFGFGPGSWGSKISTDSEVREIWDSEFEGISELGGSFILTMHPQVIGRPSRIKLLDEFISFVKSHDNSWITTCSEIATYALGKLT